MPGNSNSAIHSSILAASASASGGIFGSIVAASAAGGGSLSSSESVTFAKATAANGTRGGIVFTYPTTVTLAATVSRSGTPTRLERPGDEPRPKSRQLFKVILGEDPADSLGSPLASGDQATWRNLAMEILGTAIPDGDTFVVMAELIA